MIRDSRSEDLEDIMQIWLSTNLEVHHYIPKDFWIQNYDAVKEAISTGVYVYEEQGKILGFLGCMDCYIAGIFVNEDCRGKGVGKKLINYAKERCTNLALDVYCENKQAIEFYLREEFQIIATQANEDTGVTEYRMEWKR